MGEVVWLKVRKDVHVDGGLSYYGRLKGEDAEAYCNCGDPACEGDLIFDLLTALLTMHRGRIADWEVGIKLDGKVWRSPISVRAPGAVSKGEVH